jgi:hypothetical protein
VDFEIVGDIADIKIIAKGSGVRVRAWLDREFGKGRWRKMKGLAWIRLQNDTLVHAEVHWYEANGIGRRKFKIKRVVA